jgi:N6-adenosine-specific RNA methylase IME4
VQSVENRGGAKKTAIAGLAEPAICANGVGGMSPCRLRSGSEWAAMPDKPDNLPLFQWATNTALTLPKRTGFDDWLACGRALKKMESGIQWWIGDWWVFGENRKWGKGREIAEQVGWPYQYLADCGSVARAYQFSYRYENLTWLHHRLAMAESDPRKRRQWLARAVKEQWSTNQLKTEIARQAALDKCAKIDLDAQKLGRVPVLYGDPPWQYEHPPMGGSNRSIENHYPTMTLDQICALPVAQIAHDDSVLFLWATNPKLYEVMKVLDSWAFDYRTDMVWVKDKIGMGYYAREKHETLLIARRGELPPPVPDMRPDSVIEAPRLEHSAKPTIVYDIIDRMYPTLHKVELFNRGGLSRPLWKAWGNQSDGANEF